MDKHVTLRDIARAAGVHFTTVGMALRNNPNVSPDTAARVREVAQKLGYTPNAMLSALSAYRRGQERHFAGNLAYIATYPASDLKTNLSEQLIRLGVSRYAQSQGFGFDMFHLDASDLTGIQITRILRSRGIQGLLFAPRVDSGTVPELDWANFSPVAIGYSITNLHVNRACAHHAHNMRICLHALRERGYRRIGLILPYAIYERSRGIVNGAFLSEQYLLPKESRVSPLIAHAITKPTVAQWLRRQRIDCVILSAFASQIWAWIQELGYDVPNEIGVSVIFRTGKADPIAGIDEQLDLVGEAAARIVVPMLQHNERGLPVFPLYNLVEGLWVDSSTVRSRVNTAG